MIKKDYLGDGLYVSDDGFQFCLSTQRENGLNEVYLEPVVLSAFLRFIEKTRDVKIKVTKLKGVGYTADDEAENDYQQEHNS